MTATAPSPSRTAPSAPKTWQTWFDARPSAGIVNKSAQETLLRVFDASISKEECENKLKAHQDTVFMFHESFGTARVSLFHHFNVLGGTAYDSAKTYGIIQGVESDLTLNVTPDIEVLCKNPSGTATPVPTTTALMGIKTSAEFDTITVGTRRTYTPRNFIPVIPFLVGTISTTISKTDGSAKEVYLEVLKAIKEFDSKHASDNEYVDKAKNKCLEMIQWLFLVATKSNAIEATPITGCSKISMVQQLNTITKQCLKEGVTSPKRARESNSNPSQDWKVPLEIIAASASSNEDYLRKLTQIQEKGQEKSCKSFQKLPAKYRKMIMVASSTGGTTAEAINTQAEEFFRSSSLLHANIFLNSILESEQIDCSISNAMTTSLWHGSMLWQNSVTPSGLACCVITSDDYMKSDNLQEGLVLDYATKFEMTEKSLEKLTKTQVRFPSDIEDTIERIRALQVLCQLFFGRCSLPAQGLKGMVNKCKDNKRLLRTQHHLDGEFIPKLMCAIDHRLYQWLNQCSRVSSVEDTSIMLLTFSSLFDDIMMHRFYYILPLSVKKIKGKNEEKKDYEATREKKKPRKVEYIKNHNVPSEWKLRQGESWDTVFKDKTLSGPELSCGAKFCLKYWVKGLCFSDCRQKCTHSPLNGEDKAKADAYIKELRGE